VPILNVKNTALAEKLISYRNGDSKAFNWIFENTKKGLFTFIRRKIADEKRAEDILQNTYLKIHRCIESFDLEKGEPMSWMFQVARSCIMNELKKVYADMNSTELNDQIDGEDSSQDQDKTLVKEIITEMSHIISPEDVDLIVSRFVDGYSNEEIGQKLNFTPEKVRQRISRALKRYREWSKS